ncbi:winged helix-turn-helix domain-containing protein [Alteromonas sp. BMJM2]|uniref:winged helix-turn-helix domain-containing protein n=1 Tax=Alteromonas sp. BMJM2 TaxID=2954241 RepID=UPI0022B4F47D|nr:winged helix-turn-helix domain-containing protein [Alteromonas sp. BMJM2]
MEIYRLGSFTFSPYTKSLVLGDKEVVIEDKHNDILRCLIKRPGELVTKDELIETVWGGRYTSDNNIAAKISELRKILNDSAREPKYIRTVHNRGYVLISGIELCKAEVNPSAFEAEVNPSVTAEESSNQHTGHVEEVLLDNVLRHSALSAGNPESLISKSQGIVVTKNWYKLGVQVLLFVSLVAVGSFLLVSNEDKEAEFSYKTITHNVGLEFNPALSPDGNYLAYSHARSISGPWALKIKNLLTNQERTFTAQDYEDIMSPIWSLDGKSVFYLKNESNACSIIQAYFNEDMTLNKPTKIAECGSLPSISPISLSNDGIWLYYSYLDSNQAKLYIRRRNLLTNMESNVTTPSGNYGGDYSHSLSPDNSAILVYRSLSVNQFELKLIDLETGNRTLVDVFNSIKLAALWSKDSRSIFYFNDDKEFIEYDLETESYRVSTVDLVNPIMLSPAKGESFFVVSGNYANYDVHKLSFEHEKIKVGETPIIESSFDDYDAYADNENDIVLFVSDRSGVSQVWMLENGIYSQLTSFQRETIVRKPRLSSDATKLSYILKGDLIVEDLISHETILIAPNIRLPESSEWKCSANELYYSALDQGSRHIYRFDVKNEKRTIVKRFAERVRADCADNTYYIWSSSTGLEKILASNSESTQMPFMKHRESTFFDFDVYRGILYVSNSDSLTTYDTNGNAKFIYDLEGGILQGLTVGKLGGFYVDNKGGETAIYELTPIVH